jgi:hypothetical protein
MVIPPPRRHHHRFDEIPPCISPFGRTPCVQIRFQRICHGVLAPNAPLRGVVTGRAGLPMGSQVKGSNLNARAKAVPGDTTEMRGKSRARSTYGWAVLLARIDELFPLIGPPWGESREIIAWVTEGVSIKHIWRFAFLLRSAVQGTPFRRARSPGKSLRYAVPALLGHRSKPSVAWALGSTKLHLSFVFRKPRPPELFLNPAHPAIPRGADDPAAECAGSRAAAGQGRYRPACRQAGQTPGDDPTLAKSAPDSAFDQSVSG